MADRFTQPVRSAVMRAIKGRDTKPEMIVRRATHALGYRFRLHRKDLPGSPDLVFPRFKKVIFVHGCFWHGHDCARGSRMPKTNTDYWRAKIARNILRDTNSLEEISARGWRSLILWECELTCLSSLSGRISKFMGR